ncbi:MAG: hypothetical protein IKW39_02200 [Alphaproteobacteria bacterium]|nr:hypothetical protein [Alphaproteobacteria bacterium]
MHFFILVLLIYGGCFFLPILLYRFIVDEYKRYAKSLSREELRKKMIKLEDERNESLFSDWKLGILKEEYYK